MVMTKAGKMNGIGLRSQQFSVVEKIYTLLILQVILRKRGLRENSTKTRIETGFDIQPQRSQFWIERKFH